MRSKHAQIRVLLFLTAICFAGCGNKDTAADKDVQIETVETLTAGEATTSEEQNVTTEDNSETTEISTEQVVLDHSKCELDCVEISDDNIGLAVYENVSHDFILDLPEQTENAPLIVVMHGYGGDAEAFRSTIALEKEANASGYAVCYVTGAPSPEDATSANGWNSGIGVSSNNDVDFLCGLANYLCETYSLDSTRVFAAGFSNGAFMTHRLALEANDTFAAVVSVAGMMPESVWNNKIDTCSVGVLQITGEKDDVVPKNSDGSAKFSKAPAIEAVIDYYATMNGLALSETTDIGKKSTLTKYTSDASTKQVWNVFIPDGRHSWPDEQIVGFNTNELIIEFLETQ